MTDERQQTKAPNAEPVKVRTRWWGWLAIAILIATVALPVAMYWVPVEVAQWKAAAAIELELSGDIDGAIAAMSEAVRFAPHDANLKIRWAEMLRNQGRAEESRALSQEITNAIGEADSLGHVLLLVRATQCEMYSALQLGRGGEAVNLAKRIADLSTRAAEMVGSRSDELSTLNDLAYVRAVAGVDLAKAAWGIEKAVRGLEEGERQYWPWPMSLRSQVLTAAALVSRRLEKQFDVLPLLDEQISRLRESLHALRATNPTAIASHDSETGDKDPTKAERSQSVAAMIAQDLSSMLYVRALLLDDLELYDECALDRKAANELGGDESVWLRKLPSDVDCLVKCDRIGTILDTYAYVSFRRAGDRFALAAALIDMNIAVVCSELAVAGWDSDLQHQIQPIWDLRQRRRELRRSLAVILRHRREVFRALNLPALRERDGDRIKELGFQREDVLF